MRAQKVFFLTCCLLVAFLYGCDRGTSAAKPEQGQLEGSSVPVAVTPVRTQRVQRTVELVGTLHANEEVTVGALVEGRLASVLADLGDRVRPGEVLARIQDDEFRFAVGQIEGSLKESLAKLGLEKAPPADFDVRKTAGVLKADAELDEALAHVKRMRALYAEKVISTQEYDSAETRYKTSLAGYKNSIEEAKALVANAASKQFQLDIAKKKLADAAIRAPISGSISNRLVSAGEYVKVGAPLFTIVQDQPVKLRGLIPERFAPEIRVGQVVEVKVDAFPARPFQGKLVRVSPAAELASRSFAIEALIDNSERILKPGFFAKASIVTRMDAGALTVPQQALVQFAGLTKVFVVQGDIARERVVETGVRVGKNEVEITKGLKPGELVAVSGLSRLTDRAAVQVSGPTLPLKKDGQ
ncbi:MAG: efflux RND transporter periplasmic adaptor subunit [Deltaproteobacteria bacterium]|nr:efflux RND transporter periplasmic adaptor subunit [Deltaproteobacteria bacterium]